MKQLAIVMVLGLGFASPTVAQGPKDIVRAIKLEKVWIGDALEQLLKSRRYSYLVYPYVDGRITLDLKNVRLPDALQKIAAQVGAILVYRNGIYEFVLKGDIPRTDEPIEPQLPAVHLHKVPLARALEVLHRSSGISYNVEPAVDLHRIVTVARSGEPWWATWLDVLRQAGASCRSGGGILHVFPREDMQPGPRVARLPPDMMSVTYHRTPFRIALRAIGIWADEDWPPLKGGVSLVLENRTLEQVLDATVAQLGGVYRRVPRNSATSPSSSLPFWYEFFPKSRKPLYEWATDVPRHPR